VTLSYERGTPVHVLPEGLVGLALKLHVALGGIAHRPSESLYSTQTFHKRVTRRCRRVRGQHPPRECSTEEGEGALASSLMLKL
jgi:hypothetical protein